MTAGGTVISIELVGNKKETFSFLNNLKIISISNNLGDSRSLITHPATTTHQRLSIDQKNHLGISDGLVRLSVGLVVALLLLAMLDYSCILFATNINGNTVNN